MHYLLSVNHIFYKIGILIAILQGYCDDWVKEIMWNMKYTLYSELYIFQYMLTRYKRDQLWQRVARSCHKGGNN